MHTADRYGKFIIEKLKNSLIFSLIIVIILINGCSINETEIPLPINELIGPYCGWDMDSSTKGIVNSEIILSPIDDSTLIMKGFFGNSDVEAIRDENKLIIYPQSIGWKYWGGPWDTITVQGLGNFNPENGLLTVEYTREHTNSSIDKRTIEAYNYNKYKASGTYLGEQGNEVIIENRNNSLIISIQCFSNINKYYWENIIGFDYGCDIRISEQQVLDNTSGKHQTISGGGHKFEDTLHMYIYLYNTPYTGEEIDFFLVKREAKNLP